jgi:hypothetical protein
LVSLTGTDELTAATVRLWPTAHRFIRAIVVEAGSGSSALRIADAAARLRRPVIAVPRLAAATERLVEVIAA